MLPPKEIPDMEEKMDVTRKNLFANDFLQDILMDTNPDEIRPIVQDHFHLFDDYEETSAKNTL